MWSSGTQCRLGDKTRLYSLKGSSASTDKHVEKVNRGASAERSGTRSATDFQKTYQYSRTLTFTAVGPSFSTVNIISSTHAGKDQRSLDYRLSSVRRCAHNDVNFKRAWYDVKERVLFCGLDSGVCV